MDEPADPNVDPSVPGPARERLARTAAENAVDTDRLLPGETEDSVHAEDAEHWIAVYGELLDFKKSLSEVIQQQIENLSQAALAEVEGTDAATIRAEAERFARRLGFWRRRLEEITGNGR